MEPHINGPRWTRPLVSAFQVAFENEDYLAARKEFVELETKRWLFSKTENEKRIEVIRNRLEQVQAELTQEQQKKTDQYYSAVVEDYEQWIRQQN